MKKKLNRGNSIGFFENKKILDELYISINKANKIFSKENMANVFNKDFRRPRYSKAKFVKEELKLDVRRSILIDDSKDNIDAWVSAGGIAIWYTQDPKNNETDKYYVLRNFTYQEIMGIVGRIAYKYQIPMNQLQQNPVNTNQPKGKILIK